MVNIYDVSLLNLLPPNLKTDPDMIAAAKSIDSECFLIADEIKNCIIIPDIDNLYDEVLDLIAWQLHVDYYDNELELNKKRKLVKNSIIWHKTKGTPSAVEELITTLFGDGYVEEWYEFNGETYTFNVITSNSDVTNTKANDFQLALNSVKNCRSHLNNIIIRKTNKMNINFGAIVHTGDYMVLYQVD